jgi:TonB-linked outer membrane protein, SusC/RagA family
MLQDCNCFKTNCMKNIFLAFCLIICLVCCKIATAQNQTVKGIVVSEDGTPVSRVTVTVKGTNTAVMTNEDGVFEILADEKGVLVFSATAMETQEVPIDGRLNIRVVLRKYTKQLDDVVVIGYGSVRRRDLTGAVATLNSDELNNNRPLTIQQALQGKLAGVNVLSNDGAPGGGISIQIRGANTFSGSGEPLYVVDGVPINISNSSATPLEGTVADPNSYTKNQTNALAFLDPKDVESIQVLKDASATAIYGSRGANGVVIITTKSGKQGRPQLDFSTEQGWSHIIKFTEVMSAREYTQYINDVLYWTNYWRLYDPATGTSSYKPNPEDFPYPGIFDYAQGVYKKGPNDYSDERNVWQRAIMRSGRNQQYSIGVSGGTANTTYALRISRADQHGIVDNTRFQRNGFNFNLNQKAFKWLSLGLNSNLSYIKYNLVNTANTNDQTTMGLIKTAIYARPIDAEAPLSFLDEGGFYATSSPLAYVNTPDVTDQTSAFTNIYGEITFLPSLKLRSNLGYHYHQSQRHKYYNSNLYEGRHNQFGEGYAQEGFTRNVNMSFENTLTYDRHFQKHHLNVMGTLSMNQYEWNNQSMSVRGFGSDVTQGYDMGQAVGIPTLSSSKGQSNLMSYLGRVTYNYDNRYYATASVRHDGASNFAANNKWATFSSFALAWNAANEAFLRDVKWMDLFKFRFSYGYTGNQGIGAYASLARLIANNYPFEGTLNNGFIISGVNPGNANLKWETTRQSNFGVDLGLFDSRLNFTMDMYYKKTYDLLQYKSVAMSTGVQRMPMNIGAVENKGLELTLSATPIKNNNFTWDFSANWSTNKNKILKFGDNPDAQDLYGPYRLEGLILKEGYPIGQLYGYVEDGYWNSIDEYKNSSFYKYIQENDPASLPTDELIVQNYLGEIKYKDLNNDGQLNEYDRTMIGNVNPDFIYGFTNRFEYKKFSLNIFFQGVYGNDILNATLLNFNTTSTWPNRPPGLLDQAWTPERSVSNPEIIKYPKLGQNLNRSVRFSRRYVEDGSYLRLKNISLSYRIDKLFNLRDVKGINITFNVNNVFTITKYTGFDPEVNSAGSGNAAWRGIDVGAYPYARTYMLAMQVQF